MSISPSQTLALQRAYQALRSNRPADALSELGALLAAQPDWAEAWELLGHAHNAEGRPQDALAAFGRAAELAPRNASILNNLGNALLSLNRLAQALAAYDRALAIDPGLPEAHYNQGRALASLARTDEAIAAFEKTLKLRPQYYSAHVAYANALAQHGRYDDAKSAFDRAIALDPRNPMAHYNFGVAATAASRFDEATAALSKAGELAPDSKEIWLDLGNAWRGFGDNSKGIAAYRKALALDPAWPPAHQGLSETLWEEGEVEQHLASYRAARVGGHASPELSLGYAAALFRRGEHKDALHQAEAATYAQIPAARAMALTLLGRINAAQGDWDACFAALDRAVSEFPTNDEARGARVDANLRFGRPDQALADVERCLQMAPQSQLQLARWSLCLRELGDPRYEQMVDCQRLVRVFELPTPPNYDRAAFFEELVERLMELHTAKARPLGQTLRNGTQTFGNLLARTDPILVALRQSLLSCVRDYSDGLPQDAPRNLLVRRAQGFDFSGSWSVCLAQSGFHTNHVHPMGWISSALYLRLPKATADENRKEGWFKLGESDMSLGPRDVPQRFIKPEPGMLVLFPSYFWHGTVPFTADEQRLTVAFDAVPKT